MKFSKPSKNLSNNIKILNNFKRLKHLIRLIPGMAIGSKTCSGIDAINEIHVLGLFKNFDFGCELYKSFVQSIKRNIQTKKSNPSITYEILSGSGTNIDNEINIMSIIINAFNKWVVRLLNFIIFTYFHLILLY